MKGESRKKSNDKYIVKDFKLIKNDKVKTNKRITIKNIAVAMFLLIVVATIVFILKFVKFNVTEMIWKRSVTKGSDIVNNKSIKYEGFCNGLMRISNDGITFIDDTGNVKWTKSYDMKDPIYIGNSKYFAVSDRNGYEFYIFDKDGITGYNTVLNPIQKISMSLDGILYILQNTDEDSYINVYRHRGEEIDISIKSSLSNGGMAIDMSTSANGEELVVAYECLDEDRLYSKATYYNFGEIGQSINSKRVVREFISELENKFLARSYYFDNNNSFLIYDGGIFFITTKDPLNPTIISKKEFDIKIRSISYNYNYLAVLLEDNRMIVFNKDGMLIADKKIDYDYENFYINENFIIFLYGNRVMIYDTRGRMIFDKEMEIEVQYVAKKNSLLFTELLLGLVDGVECIRFY